MSIRSVILSLGGSSVVIALGLAGFGLVGVQQQLDARERVVVLEAALKNHDSADAFMDSIRTDVLRALQFAIGVNQEGSAAIRQELAHHVDVLTTAIGENQGLAMAPELHDAYQRIDSMLPSFVLASEKAVGLALTDPTAGAANFEVFRRSFTDLEQLMDNVRDVVRVRVNDVRAGAAHTARFGRALILGSLAGGILLLTLMTALAIRIAHKITSALAALQEEAHHLALHDNLTGLANRRLFSERLQHDVTRDGATVALLYLDLDRFKQVNDTLGHPVGDSLLKAVADRLNACVRRSDMVARLGGDEFTIILSPATGIDEAEEFAHRVIASLSAPYLIETHELRIGVSIGIALAPLHTRDTMSLLALADQALYQAKADGRGVARTVKLAAAPVRFAPDPPRPVTRLVEASRMRA